MQAGTSTSDETSALLKTGGDEGDGGGNVFVISASGDSLSLSIRNLCTTRTSSLDLFLPHHQAFNQQVIAKATNHGADHPRSSKEKDEASDASSSHLRICSSRDHHSLFPKRGRSQSLSLALLTRTDAPVSSVDSSLCSRYSEVSSTVERSSPEESEEKRTTSRTTSRAHCARSSTASFAVAWQKHPTIASPMHSLLNRRWRHAHPRTLGTIKLRNSGGDPTQRNWLRPQRHPSWSRERGCGEKI